MSYRAGLFQILIRGYCQLQNIGVLEWWFILIQTQFQFINYFIIMKCSQYSLDQSIDTYLSAFLAFYTPSFSSQFQKLKQTLTTHSSLKSFIANLQKPIDSSEKILLVQKRQQIDNIMGGRFKPISLKFMGDMEEVFGKVETKKDIDYFKYKVLNGKYEAEQEYLELKVSPKQFKQIKQAIDINLPKLISTRKLRQILDEIYQKMEIHKFNAITAKLDEITEALLGGDEGRLRAIEQELYEKEITMNQFKMFKKMTKECLTALKNKKQISQKSSMINEGYKSIILVQIAQPLEIYSKFAQEIQKVYKSLSRQNYQQLYVNKFGSGEYDFERFCIQLFQLDKWEANIQNIYKLRQQQLLIPRIKPIMENQKHSRQYLINCFITYNFKFNWGYLPTPFSVENQEGEDQIMPYFKKIVSQNSQVLAIIKIFTQYLYHCIASKLDIRQLLSCIQSIRSQQFKDPNIKQILLFYQILDYLPILVKNYLNKEELGYYLYNYRIDQIDSLPLPLYFTVVNHIKEKVQVEVNIQLLYLIQDKNQVALIVNLGSSLMKRKGKTTFLSNYFGLKTYTKSSFSSFGSESVIMYALGPNQTCKKKLIFVDFNGDIFKNENESLKKIMKVLFENASFVFLHLHQNQIKLESCDQYFQKLEAFKAKNVQLVVKISNSQKIQMISYEGRKINYSNQLKSASHNRRASIKEKTGSSGNKKIMQSIAESATLYLQKIISEFEDKVSKKMQSLIKVLNQNFQKEEDFYQSTFPNIIAHQKQSKQYLASIDDGQQQNFEIGLFQKNDQKFKLSGVIQTFFDLFDNQRKIEKRLFCQTMLQNWASNNKEKLNNNSEANIKINLQTFILQLICHNQRKYDFEIISNRLNFNEQLLKIKQFYLQSIRLCIPISLIDGVSLSFGSKSFSQTLQECVSFKKKKTFVISIIGCQSHAKSSLLNSLFMVRFPVSIGKCTFGVNMVLKQLEDTVLVILDYEGLQSISRKDQDFDIRITSFAIILSDLLIINHKGELIKSLEDVINNCQYVVKNINKEPLGSNFTQNYKPGRTIVALRDINLNDEQSDSRKLKRIQQKEIEKIIDHFSAQIQDMKLKITEQDVFIFQNAFFNQPNHSRKWSQQFIKKIQIMRQSILDGFKNSSSRKHKNLQDFYVNAERCWNILKKLSKDKLNKYKMQYQQEKQAEMIKQIKTKYDLQLQNYLQIYQEMFQRIQNQISQTAKEAELKLQKKKWLKEMLTHTKQAKEHIYDTLTRFMDENKYLAIRKSQLRKYQTKLKNFENDQYLKLINLINQKYELIKRDCYEKDLKDKLNSKNYQDYQSKSQILRFLNEQYQLQKVMLQEQLELEQRYLNYAIQSIQSSIISQISLNRQSQVMCEMSRLAHQKAKRSTELRQNYQLLKYEVRQWLKKLYLEHNNLQEIQNLTKFQIIYQKIIINGVTKHTLPYLYENFIESNQYVDVNTLRNLRDPTIGVNIYTFFVSGMKVLKETITSSTLRCQKQEITSFLDKIYQKLSQQYKNLTKLFKGYPPIQIESCSQQGKLNKLIPKPQQVYLRILYASIPKLTLQRIVQQKIGLIKSEIAFRKQVRIKIQQELQVVGSKTSHQKCKYWVKRFLQYLFKKEKGLLYEKIQKFVCNRLIKPQKIIMKMLTMAIFKQNKKTTEDWIQCYKATSNTPKYIKELYHDFFFKHKVYPQLIQLCQTAKSNINQAFKMISEAVENLRQDRFKINDKIPQVFQILLNGQQLYFQQYWDKDDTPILIGQLDTYIRFKENQIKNQIEGYLNELENLLNNSYMEILERWVFPKIVGCTHRCPNCGMKCRYDRNHIGRHQIIPGTHLLKCFRVTQQLTENELQWCCNRKVSKKSEEILQQLPVEQIGWYQELINSSEIKNVESYNQILSIWANIGQVYCQKLRIDDMQFNKQSLNNLRTQKYLRLQNLNTDRLKNYHLQ